jgi:hypothetical protein
MHEMTPEEKAQMAEDHGVTIEEVEAMLASIGSHKTQSDTSIITTPVPH